MGRTVKDKHIKKSVKPSSSNVNYNNNNNLNDNNGELNSSIAKNRWWGYYTDEQLEEILLKQLKDLYGEAVSKLVALGYDKEVALKAVLRNGHCYGGMDVLANVLRNSMNYLLNGNDNEPDHAFTELKELEEYSLAGMVCLLQQVHPHLSRGDAMWCLLMSDLHLGRANSLDLKRYPRPRKVSGDGISNVESDSNVADGSKGSKASVLCKFHGCGGFGNEGNLEASVTKKTDCPHRFEIIPPMNSGLQRNVAGFSDGCRSKQQQQKPQVQSQPRGSLTTDGDSSKAFVPATDVAPSKTSQESLGNEKDVANSVMNKFRDLSLDDTLDRMTEEQKEEMVLFLLHQINDLEKQVNERKDWAQQKAMQAARKLSSDLTELKLLRTEQDETQKLKRVKQVLEDNTMKRLSELENALRKASSQVDCANAAVKQLEMENAEIRAEMEASKLSASESVKTCLEISKREKKNLKKLLAWEKQKAKLQDEIAAVKQKYDSLQQQLVQIRAAQKEAEAKWAHEVKEKELAMSLVEEERRSKETTEVNNKRKLEALRSRIEMEFQRHKDDLRRLEQELSRLKETSQGYQDPNKQSNTYSLPGKAKHQGQTIANLLRELDEPERGNGTERECMICLRDDVSVVFLPCAHQVMCSSCGEEYGKRAKATCPCCRAPIEQRIRVFGASS